MTGTFAFDEGTVAVKPLFSLATPEEEPYLRHSKVWNIHDGEKIVEARPIQFDLLVKDKRVADFTAGSWAVTFTTVPSRRRRAATRFPPATRRPASRRAGANG